MGSLAKQRDLVFSGLENGNWFDGFFFYVIWGLGAFPPLLRSRFAVPAFLRLGRDSPNLDVLGLSMSASLGWVDAVSPSALPEKSCPGLRGGLCHSSA